MGGEHGSFFVHEESAPLHLPEPPQTRLLTLPEHQICPIYTFQPLYTLQQVTPSAGAGAAGAQPALPAAVQWLSCLAVVETWHGPSLSHTAVPLGPNALSGDRPVWPVVGEWPWPLLCPFRSPHPHLGPGVTEWREPPELGAWPDTDIPFGG